MMTFAALTLLVGAVELWWDLAARLGGMCLDKFPGWNATRPVVTESGNRNLESKSILYDSDYIIFYSVVILRTPYLGSIDR